MPSRASLRTVALPPPVRAVIEARPLSPHDHLPWPRIRQGRPVLDVCGTAVDVWTLLWTIVTRGGRVPDGCRVEAICGRASCVRPGHLRAQPKPREATPRVPSCKRGHDLFRPVNVFWSVNRWRCRVCIRDRNRAKTDAAARTHPEYRRGTNGLYPVCRRGHPLEGDNVAVDSRGRRQCVTCRREYARRWYAKNKAAQQPDVRAS